MRLSLPLVLLIGCGSPEPAPLASPDGAALSPALAAARVEPLVDLVEDPREALGVEADCPSVEVLDASRELWIGGCAMSDGTIVSGLLTRYDGPEGAWVAAEGFSMRQDDELLLYLDGAVELTGEGDEVTLDAAASLCGFGGPCSDGLLTLDLSFTLFPLASYPLTYDATVTGVVASDGGAPIALDGAWSIDEPSCASEPASGLFTLRRGERQALELDGGVDCDGCVRWSVQGLPVGEYCGAGL